jgi:hypothetical protein
VASSQGKGGRERHIGWPWRARAAFPSQAPVPTEGTVSPARLDLTPRVLRLHKYRRGHEDSTRCALWEEALFFDWSSSTMHRVPNARSPCAAMVAQEASPRDCVCGVYGTGITMCASVWQVNEGETRSRWVVDELYREQ